MASCPPHDYRPSRVKDGEIITVTWTCAKCGDSYTETEYT